MVRGDDFYPGDEDETSERDAAERRIDRIRRGDTAPVPPVRRTPDPGDDVPDPVEAGYARSRVAYTEEPTEPSPDFPGLWVAALLLGGLLVVGVIIFGLVLLLGGSPFGGAVAPPAPTLTLTPTETILPTITVTPEPTLSPTPAATATPEVPFLPLPPLACAYDPGVDCLVYCNDPANISECDAAEDFVAEQGADFNYWISCVSEGVSSPQVCMEEAWLVMQP